MPKGRVIRALGQPGPDGTQWLIVDIDGLGQCQVALAEDDAVAIVLAIQQQFFARRVEMAQPPAYPVLEVRGVHIGHGEEGRSTLLVETAQTATVALVGTPAVYAKMKVEIEGLLETMRRKDAAKN